MDTDANHPTRSVYQGILTEWVRRNRNGKYADKQKQELKGELPHIVIGTPGRVLSLANDKVLDLKSLKFFILDECDKMLESLGTLS